MQLKVRLDLDYVSLLETKTEVSLKKTTEVYVYPKVVWKRLLSSDKTAHCTSDLKLCIFIFVYSVQ